MILIYEQRTGVIFSLVIIISQGPFKIIIDYLKKKFLKFTYPLSDLRKLFLLITWFVHFWMEQTEFLESNY